jgi:hypothetical protein
MLRIVMSRSIEVLPGVRRGCIDGPQFLLPSLVRFIDHRSEITPVSERRGLLFGDQGAIKGLCPMGVPNRCTGLQNRMRVA